MIDPYADLNDVKHSLLLEVAVREQSGKLESNKESFQELWTELLTTLVTSDILHK